MRSAGSWFAAFFTAGGPFATPALAQNRMPPAVGSEALIGGSTLGAVHSSQFAHVVDVPPARGDRRQAA